MIVECPSCASRYDVTGRPPGTRARCRCGQIFMLPEPSREAGMLACPRCGGDVAATNHDCEYCGVALLVKACPRCFSRIFHGAKHCRHCGADAVAPARADADGVATQRKCPRCIEPELVAQFVGDVLLDECPRCHGVWVDIGVLERILTERRQARAEAILGRTAPSDSASDGLLPQPDGPMYVACPDCGATMHRTMFARTSRVIVDVCRKHGTWFDTGELSRVVEFVMSGGLERAAVIEAEAQLQEARAVRSSQNMPAPVPLSQASTWSGDLFVAEVGVNALRTVASTLGGLIRHVWK